MESIQQELLKKLSNESSINEIQSYIKEVMQIRGFNKEKSSDKILLLVEEVGELAKAIRKNESNLGIDKTKEYNYSSIESEIADVFIVLLSICDILNINLFKAFLDKEEENIKRIIEMSKKTEFIIRLDSLEAAIKINKIAETENIIINYTIIVDSGLHRFGVSLKNLLAFAEEMKKLKHLKLEGLSSHPGHVYSSTCEADIHQYVLDECETLRKAKELLEKEGYHLKYITSGSTPTFEEAVKDSNINVYHPGNYVFLDSIQLSINKAKIKDCALTVLATIISHPSENLFICDAGAKCLGLDQGAHGNSSIIGYGTVINHPEIIVSSLSEEVGKLKIEGQTNLKVGDKIEIIPNHSCCLLYTSPSPRDGLLSPMPSSA